MRNWFTRFAARASGWAGHYVAFVLAFLIIAVWAVTGPLFGFGTTWQLVINTATTIVTFLMVFIIQNSQNRDSRALHLKLDELIRAVDRANNQLIDAEEADDDELDELKQLYSRISSEHAAAKDRALEGDGLG